MAKAAKKEEQQTVAKKIGRPTSYSEEIAHDICLRLTTGESLRAICLSEEMPDKATVFRWLADSRYRAFRDQYAYAREVQAETMAEEILSIADDGKGDKYIDADGKERVDNDAIGRSKLRVDARKWLASKLYPKRYGDRLIQEVGGLGGEAIKHDITLSPTDAYLKMIGKK